MVSSCLPQLQHVVMSQLILSCSFAQPHWVSSSRLTRAVWTRAQNLPLVWTVLAENIVSSFIIISNRLSLSLHRKSIPPLRPFLPFLHHWLLVFSLLRHWYLLQSKIIFLLFFHLCLWQRWVSRAWTLHMVGRHSPPELSWAPILLSCELFLNESEFLSFHNLS